MRRLLIVVLLLLFGGCISHDPGTLRHYPHLHSYTPCPMYAGWESHYADPEYHPPVTWRGDGRGWRPRD